MYNNAPITQANFTQELKLLGYKTSSNYDKSGTYVAQGSNMYVHTRGFDYGDSVEPEQVFRTEFCKRPSCRSSQYKTVINWGCRLEPLLIGAFILNIMKTAF
ncbi:hypothetical protein AB3538_15300 [Acinetobacter baumannii]